MKIRDVFLKISKFLLLLGFFSLNNQLLAEYKKNCPENFPSEGISVKMLDKNQFKINITKTKFLKDAFKNKSLTKHIALLKLEAVEDYQKFLKTDISSTPTKYGGYKTTERFDNSWNTMKKSIVSMIDVGTCIEGDLVKFSGQWSPKSVESASRIIELEDVFYELYNLEMEDPKFDIDKLVKKYPTILQTNDPEVLKKVINYWRKNRAF